MKKTLLVLLLTGYTLSNAPAGEPNKQPLLARIVNSLNPFAPNPAAQTVRTQKVKKYKQQKAIPNTYYTD